jgi:hypothetical protein
MLQLTAEIVVMAGSDLSEQCVQICRTRSAALFCITAVTT